MKHTVKQGIKAKENLIIHYGFRDVDFYEDDDTIYLSSQDNAGESAFDVYREIMLTLRESCEATSA